MKMHKAIPIIGAAAAAVALGACSGPSYQQSLEPSHTTTNPGNATLQFAVGTANVGGTIGLNTLSTLRQNSSETGASVLVNAPTIVGPAGFIVPSDAVAADAEGDAGTNHISGALQTSIASPPPPTTFSPQGDLNATPPPGCPGGQTCYGIASSYGFLPGGVINTNLAPDLEPYALPFYSAANGALTGATVPGPYQYIGGPPAFQPPGHTSTQDGTFGATGFGGAITPGSYPGYTLGFVDFQAAPVAGSYTLNVVIPTGINSSGSSGTLTKTAAATLTSVAGLPTWSTPPTFAPDGTGGGLVTLNFAAGGGITEEFVTVENLGPGSCQLSGAAPYFYTFKVTPGAISVAVPDSIGAAQPNEQQPHTFCTAADNGGASGPGEDSWEVYGFAVDYPLAESAFPASQGVVAPTIIGAAGQDDVTTSFASTGGPAPAAAHLRKTPAGLRHR